MESIKSVMFVSLGHFQYNGFSVHSKAFAINDMRQIIALVS